MAVDKRQKLLRTEQPKLPELMQPGREFVSAFEALVRVDAVGKLSFRESMGLLQPRYGRMVSTESPVTEFVEGGDEERRIIAAEIERLTSIREALDRGDKQMGGRRIREKPDVLLRKMEILQALQSAERGRYGRTASQLCGIMVYQFGFEPYELDDAGGQVLDRFNRPVPTDLLKYLNATRDFPKRIVSRTDAVVETARNGVLRDMHELLLHREPGQPKVLTSEDIIDALGIYPRFGYDPKSREGRIKASRLVSVAGGVLEAMGLAMKLPKETQGSHTFFNWCHRAHSESRETIPTESIDYALAMELLQRGRTPVQELARIYDMPGHGMGERRVKELSGPFNPASLNHRVRNLEAEGVARITKEHTTNYVELTPRAAEIIRRQREFIEAREREGKEPYLLEETRRLIMGSYAQTATPRDIRRAEMIVRGARILRRMERMLEEQGVEVDGFFRPGGGGIPALLEQARQYNVSPVDIIHDMYGQFNRVVFTYIGDMLRDGTVPWRNVTLDSMTNTYLPLIEEGEERGDIEPGTSDWIKKWVLQELK